MTKTEVLGQLVPENISIALTTQSNSQAAIVFISKTLSINQENALRIYNTWSKVYREIHGIELDRQQVYNWLSECNVCNSSDSNFEALLTETLCTRNIDFSRAKLEILHFVDTMDRFLKLCPSVMPLVYHELILSKPVKTLAQCTEGMQIFMHNCEATLNNDLRHYDMSLGMWISMRWKVILDLTTKPRPISF